MARRRLTVKRIDPWSVLKFGLVANVVLLAIFLMLMGVVWFIVDRLQLVDQVCGIATDVGFDECGINGGNLFRSLILLGLLWVVIQTAVLVFFSFLYNLISDLTGGLGLTIVDDSLPGSGATTGVRPRQVATAGPRPGDLEGARGATATARSSGNPEPTGHGPDGSAPIAAPPTTGARPAGAARPADAVDASTGPTSRTASDEDLFRGRR